MKKYIIVLVLGLLLVAALATTATADNGPHGGFTATTEKCAGCHRAHSAQGITNLLVASTEAICLSCHNGAGAYTNVVDGVYVSTAITVLAAPLGAQGDGGITLFGGGFTNTSMVNTWNGKEGYDAAAAAPASHAVTSSHSVNGSAQAIWGSGNINNSTLGSVDLECTSCHDPHGRAGRGETATSSTWTASTQGGISTGLPMPSYRLLRFQPTGSAGFEVTGTSVPWWSAGNAQSTDGITVRETASYWYTPNTKSTLDGTVMFYRSRWEGTAWGTWSSYISQVDDLAGRNYVYQRPATTITVNATLRDVSNSQQTSVVTCKDPTLGLPSLPTLVSGTTYTANTYTNCATTSGTTFNNSNTTLAGTGTTNRTAGRAQLGYWCGTCHDRYVSGTVTDVGNGREIASGDSYYMYRHNSTGSVPCVDCHVAHGTGSVMTNTNATYASASLTTGSILMKLDERSICLKCHGHNVNFNYVP